MANEEQVQILKQGTRVWNKWREQNPSIEINLVSADLGAALLLTNLSGAKLDQANLENANLSSMILEGAALRGANLREADLRRAHLRGANLAGSKLIKANLEMADLTAVNFNGADLSEAYLVSANLLRASLERAVLIRSVLSKANLDSCNLSKADLTEANLYRANLNEANLGLAILREANLRESSLVRTKIEQADFSGCAVYGTNIWDLVGKFKAQRDLIITRKGKPVVTVDDIKVAQFIYLILDHPEIRDVINTLTSKTVLILGRFALSERKAVLDALKLKLRENNLLPIVFDFERPEDRDFTETIKTLAGLSFFVIADITNPRATPLELQAVVPDYQIPFVPILQKGEEPFSMMRDLQTKYKDWVLDTLEYETLDELIEVLRPAIIDPAIEKHNELKLIKARDPQIRFTKDFLKK